MPNDSEKDLPLFPFTRDRQLNLPSEYEEVSGGCPMPVRLWNEQPAWLIGRHADFLSVLVDDRFSGQFARPDFPCVTEARRAIDKAEKSKNAGKLKSFSSSLESGAGSERQSHPLVASASQAFAAGSKQQSCPRL